MIRGKGATKEGKLGRSGLPQPGEDEPLHALITGQSPEVVKDAVDKVCGLCPLHHMHTHMHTHAPTHTYAPTHIMVCEEMSLVQIKKIIQSGIDNPGNDNELKQLQLQQLAELNGTFKPIDVLR